MYLLFIQDMNWWLCWNVSVSKWNMNLISCCAVRRIGAGHSDHQVWWLLHQLRGSWLQGSVWGFRCRVSGLQEKEKDQGISKCSVSIRHSLSMEKSPSCVVAFNNPKFIQYGVVVSTTWAILSYVISTLDHTFLFFGLQIRRLYFKQIEIRIKSYFLDFFLLPTG